MEFGAVNHLQKKNVNVSHFSAKTATKMKYFLWLRWNMILCIFYQYESQLKQQ